MRFTCKSCDKEKEIKQNTCAVGDMIKWSGYYPVFCEDGELVWYCPECWDKIKELALKLKSLLKHEFVPIDYLK